MSAVDNGYHETFSLSTLWNEANLTIIQIMQLKRSYFRRLKIKIDFYAYYFIARHAYYSLWLAVKTNRPQIFKEQN